MIRPQYLILPSLLLLASLSTSVAARASTGPLSGSWQPIKDIKDPHVKDIAKFALSEHNKKSGEKLKLVEIIKGETQVVAGTNYRLIIKAKDGSTTKEYVAVLSEEPAKNHLRNLNSFQPLLT